MTFFLRHKARMLVVFAITATIGLSSCADTITGSEILKSEDALQETATHNTYSKARVLPTPGNDLSQLDGTTGQPTLQGAWGLAPDSSSAGGSIDNIQPPAPQKMKDRF